jgi:hypothetical protein
MEFGGQLHAPAAYFQERTPYPPNRRLVGPKPVWAVWRSEQSFAPVESGGDCYENEKTNILLLAVLSVHTTSDCYWQYCQYTLLLIAIGSGVSAHSF